MQEANDLNKRGLKVEVRRAPVSVCFPPEKVGFHEEGCLGLPGAVLELLGAEARNMNSFSGRNLPLVSKNLLFSKITDTSILMFLDKTGMSGIRRRMVIPCGTLSYCRT